MREGCISPESAQKGEMELQFQVRHDMAKLGISHLCCQEPNEGNKARGAVCRQGASTGFVTPAVFLVICLHQRGPEVLK